MDYSQLQGWVAAIFALAVMVERLLQMLLNAYSVIEPVIKVRMSDSLRDTYTKYRFIIIESVSIPVGMAIGCIIVTVGDYSGIYDSLDVNTAERYAVAIVAGVIAPYAHQLLQIGVKLQRQIDSRTNTP